MFGKRGEGRGGVMRREILQPVPCVLPLINAGTDGPNPSEQDAAQRNTHTKNLKKSALRSQGVLNIYITFENSALRVCFLFPISARRV